MNVEYTIGFRYLWSRQKVAFLSLITVLSTLGVAVGVMVLIVVIAVMTGFESELTSRILGIEAHVLVLRYGEPIEQYKQVARKIRPIDGVTSASPFIFSQAMIRSRSELSGLVLRGIDPATTGKRLSTTDGMTFGAAFDAALPANTDNVPKIILGKVLADKLGVAKGDLVQLISSQVGGSRNVMPSIKRVQVLAFFETGMNEYDGAMGFLTLGDAQNLLHMQGLATGIEVRIQDIYRAGEIAQKITQRLDFPYWTRDWIQMNRNLFSMLRLQKIVMFIILALIVLVAAFNIASTLIMMVMEKTRDIAILKTMGATEATIRKIFVFKGLMIGLVGTLAGVVLGVSVCFLLQRYQFIDLPGDVYFLTTLPVQLNLMDISIIVLATLFICWFATVIPSRQAGRFHPVDGIRYG
jgi:lipoprotein-releasing system permease protein